MANWKTTVAGFAGGLIPIVESIRQALQNGVPINWAVIAAGVAIMALGLAAGDGKSKT